MKAVFYNSPGDTEVLCYEDVSDPSPHPGDVVVKVEATALNRLDVIQRNGWFQMPGFAYPHIAGMDVAGHVVAVGSDITASANIAAGGTKPIAVGDRVVIDPSMSGVTENSKYRGMGDLYGDLGIIGATLDGGYAELCLAPASHVYPIPEHVSSAQAATFPTCYMTAAHALFDVGKLVQGEVVLIHAAGSGVSSAAIQLAKKAGAVVLATAGTDEKCAKAQTIGADHSCNNRTSDITAWAREVTDGRGVDMVFDHVGPALWEASIFALAVKGRVVVCGGTTGDVVSIPSVGMFYHLGLSICGSDPYRPEEFEPVWEQFCSEDFEVVIDSEFPLSEAAAAQEKMLNSDFFGKILLRP